MTGITVPATLLARADEVREQGGACQFMADSVEKGFLG